MEKIIIKQGEGKDFGNSAYDAYRMLARRYNWNLTMASNFEPKRILYAKGATTEGYGVWFVVHSNFISDDDTNGLWKNTFKKDMLFEEWFPAALIKRGLELNSDKGKRVVFAKKASGKYYFMGIYEIFAIEKNNDGNYVRIYKKTSAEYPEQDK